MARSPQYWYDFMITELNTMASLSSLQPNIDTAQDLLNDLKSSTSKVARWRLVVWIVATCAFSIETIFDLAIIMLENLARKSRFGTIPWYNNTALLFQLGDALVWQNDEYIYPIINPANQIIKRAAAEENGNVVNIKLATLVGTVTTKLNVVQKAAATAYFQKLKPAGITINIISEDPDEVRLFINVNYDPLLLDSTGQLLSTTGVYPVVDAINGFLTNLNYNWKGILELSDLLDAIKKSTGVVSPYITQASARFGTNAFVIFTERYHSNTGHMKIDPLNPLSTTINYQPIN